MAAAALDFSIGKRGEAALRDALFYLFDLIIVVVVAAILFNAVKTQVANPLVEQQYLATELGLLLEAAQAAPGNAVVLYSAPNLDFRAQVERDSTRVAVEPSESREGGSLPMLRGKSQPRLRAFSFHQDAFLRTQYLAVETDKMALLGKTDSLLQLGPVQKAKVPLGPFPIPVDTAAVRGAQVVLDPEADSAATRKAAMFVIGGEVLDDMPFADKQAQMRDAGVRIILRTMLPDGNPVQQAELRIPPDSPESRKLAALILDQLPAVDGVIIPVSEQYLPEGDSQLLLGEIGVEVRLPPDAFAAPEVVGEALEQAVNGYFQPSVVVEPAAPEGKSEVIGNARIISAD